MKQTKQPASKLSSAGHSITSLRSITSQNSLRTIYFSHVHSTMSYGLVFWGNSPYSSSIFKIQKRLIRIITNAGYRDSSHPLFKQSNILPNTYFHWGRDSSLGIVTRYGLDGLGIESQWGQDFLHTSRPTLGPTQPTVQQVPGLYRG
jgi:hypothetical protein